jgi:Carboxypeptidase regulatory-like domain
MKKLALGFVKATLVLIALVVIPATAHAQASIVGTVRDSSGAVIPSVTVEASSPVLIEKTRSVITNGSGQYSIEDLRPGTYTVTFTLPGFTSVKREGIELAGTFIATVNADMAAGGVAETVTVTADSPVVDTTSTRDQQVLSGLTVIEIPTSRNYSAFTHLIPAINVQENDFEGTNPALYSVFQIHGGRRNEGQVLVDGMNGGYQGMGVSGYVPEVGNAQEVVFSLSGGLGEATTGGPQMNIVGKQGGNQLHGTIFFSGTGSVFQGSNVSSDVRAKGLTATNSIQKLFETNVAFGGPIVRDKLWFYATYAARGQCAVGALLLVGQPSEKCVRQDAYSGAGERRPHSEHQLPWGQLERAQGIYEHHPGGRFVHYRIALREIRLPLAQQRRPVPEELLQ